MLASTKFIKKYNADGNGYKWVDARTKAEKENDIRENIKEVQFPQYNGYALIDSIKGAIARALFFHISGDSFDKFKDEEKEKTERIFTAMVNNGYLKISKSGEMAKLVK